MCFVVVSATTGAALAVDNASSEQLTTHNGRHQVIYV